MGEVSLEKRKHCFSKAVPPPYLPIDHFRRSSPIVTCAGAANTAASSVESDDFDALDQRESLAFDYLRESNGFLLWLLDADSKTALEVARQEAFLTFVRSYLSQCPRWYEFFSAAERRREDVAGEEKSGSVVADVRKFDTTGEAGLSFNFDDALKPTPQASLLDEEHRQFSELILKTLLRLYGFFFTTKTTATAKTTATTSATTSEEGRAETAPSLLGEQRCNATVPVVTSEMIPLVDFLFDPTTLADTLSTYAWATQAPMLVELCRVCWSPPSSLRSSSPTKFPVQMHILDAINRAITDLEKELLSCSSAVSAQAESPTSPSSLSPSHLHHPSVTQPQSPTPTKIPLDQRLSDAFSFATDLVVTVWSLFRTCPIHVLLGQEVNNLTLGVTRNVDLFQPEYSTQLFVHWNQWLTESKRGATAADAETPATDVASAEASLFMSLVFSHLRRIFCALLRVGIGTPSAAEVGLVVCSKGNTFEWRNVEELLSSMGGSREKRDYERSAAAAAAESTCLQAYRALNVVSAALIAVIFAPFFCRSAHINPALTHALYARSAGKRDEKRTTDDAAAAAANAGEAAWGNSEKIGSTLGRGSAEDDKCFLTKRDSAALSLLDMIVDIIIAEMAIAPMGTEGFTNPAEGTQGKSCDTENSTQEMREVQKAKVQICLLRGGLREILNEAMRQLAVTVGDTGKKEAVEVLRSKIFSSLEIVGKALEVPESACTAVNPQSLSEPCTVEEAEAISSVQEVLAGLELGDGYVLMGLRAMDHDSEKLIAAILEDSLPKCIKGVNSKTTLAELSAQSGTSSLGAGLNNMLREGLLRAPKDHRGIWRGARARVATSDNKRLRARARDRARVLQLAAAQSTEERVADAAIEEYLQHWAKANPEGDVIKAREALMTLEAGDDGQFMPGGEKEWDKYVGHGGSGEEVEEREFKQRYLELLRARRKEALRPSRGEKSGALSSLGIGELDGENEDDDEYDDTFDWSDSRFLQKEGEVDKVGRDELVMEIREGAKDDIFKDPHQRELEYEESRRLKWGGGKKPKAPVRNVVIGNETRRRLLRRREEDEGVTDTRVSAVERRKEDRRGRGSRGWGPRKGYDRGRGRVNASRLG